MDCTSTFLRAPAEMPPEPAQNPSNTADSVCCCAGTDFPGLGFVHSTKCPVSPGKAQRFGAGELPDPLSLQLRDDWVIALVFASLRLAHDCLAHRSFLGGMARETRCTQCQMAAVGEAAVVHTASCNTGRVLGLIAQLTQESTSAPKQEVTAPREWVIQRCTQEWDGTELRYEDFSTPEGLMTRSQMIEVLDRVNREHPESEFKGHRVLRNGGGL